MKYAGKKKTNTIRYHLYMDSKIWHEWTYLWNRNRPADIEKICGRQEEGDCGWRDWKFGTSRCNPLMLQIEGTDNSVLLSSTGNYIQYPAIKHKAKEHGRCIYVTELLSCRAQISNTLQINSSSIKTFFKKRAHSVFLPRGLHRVDGPHFVSLFIFWWTLGWFPVEAVMNNAWTDKTLVWTFMPKSLCEGSVSGLNCTYAIWGMVIHSDWTRWSHWSLHISAQRKTSRGCLGSRAPPQLAGTLSSQHMVCVPLFSPVTGVSSYQTSCTTDSVLMSAFQSTQPEAHMECWEQYLAYCLSLWL